MTAQGNEHGRVDADGTVYVRVGEQEYVVGQYPEGTPEEALAFYTRRYDALAFEVQLLEQRVRAAAMSPDEALESINRVAAQLEEPHAVGDIKALVARLDALRPVIGLQREKRREELICGLTGWRCIRIVWADLYRPELVIARIVAAMRGENWAA